MSRPAPTAGCSARGCSPGGCNRSRTCRTAQAILVRWFKRRFAGAETACRRRTLSEVTGQLRWRRLTLRLRAKLEALVSGGPRSVADVAREYGVSWWSAKPALIDRAVDLLGSTPDGVRGLGIDETRVRRVRWLLEAGWHRSDSSMISLFDLDPQRRGGLLALTPGRSARP